MSTQPRDEIGQFVKSKKAPRKTYKQAKKATGIKKRAKTAKGKKQRGGKRQKVLQLYIKR